MHHNFFSFFWNLMVLGIMQAIFENLIVEFEIMLINKNSYVIRLINL